ncbi:zinc ribbon domain-containing protein [Pseudonocardia hydrocarbonoxydans]|uniref:Putative regulatory protein FmdB zinc ribbon domain-containing protein n=1 Tax=Pseudonocardia hydrocarbonoxydans TaxID=76726 RepID=A0A4Y3WMS2_9PSEU|nr:zinc ribbon domain-containing protein [Pseudonocardia hydrocarbonoxydans]GEC19778.1 hypothetical protein PHY01_20610 [Pseudonocardia hydrocarbonoxydans]
MATYTYRCAGDGPVDVRLPIGTAPASVACPRCGDPSTRVFTAPLLGLGDRRRMAVIDHAESTRSDPTVVSSVPSAPRPGRSRAVSPGRLDPRMRALPRP